MTHKYNTRNKVNYPVITDPYETAVLSLYGYNFYYDEDDMIYEDHLMDVGRISDDRSKIIWDIKKLRWAKKMRHCEGFYDKHDDLDHIISLVVAGMI
jgi:hypothetical protein